MQEERSLSEEKELLYQARVDKPLGKEAFKVIDLVIQWSSKTMFPPVISCSLL